MSRRRYISTNISLDPKVNKLAMQYGDFAALLYTWLIPHADDSGRVTADPEELLYLVIPGRRDKDIEDVARAVDGMITLGLITKVTEDGKTFLQFPESFFKYQSYIPAHKRKSKQKNNRCDIAVVDNEENNSSAFCGDTNEENNSSVFCGDTSEKNNLSAATAQNSVSPSPSPSPSNNNISSSNEEQPPAVVGSPPNGKEIIAKLVAQYREVVPEDKHTKHDYSFVGRLYKEYGHDTVLSAINELGYRIEGGKPPDEPLIYLRGILKNQADKPAARASPEEPPEDPIKAAIEHNRRVIEEIERQRRKRLEQMEQRIAAWAKAKKK